MERPCNEVSEWQVSDKFPVTNLLLFMHWATRRSPTPTDKAPCGRRAVWRCWQFKWVSSASVVLIVFEEKGGSLPMCRKPMLLRQAEVVILLKAASLQEWLKNSGKNLQPSSECCETFWRVSIALVCLISSLQKRGTEGEVYRAEELVLKIQHYRIAHSRCVPRKHLPLSFHNKGIWTAYSKNTVTWPNAH